MLEFSDHRTAITVLYKKNRVQTGFGYTSNDGTELFYHNYSSQAAKITSSHTNMRATSLKIVADGNGNKH